jgi:hypothetical protein
VLFAPSVEETLELTTMSKHFARIIETLKEAKMNSEAPPKIAVLETRRSRTETILDELCPKLIEIDLFV